MKTSPNQRFNMQATDLCKGGFPYIESAYSWQWIYKVSDFDISLQLQPLSNFFLSRNPWIVQEKKILPAINYLSVKSIITKL